jgi:8-oxo-dGTP pyrophosphatase MutT (NUDIX family)
VRWGRAAAGIAFVAGNRVLLTYRSAHVMEPHTWGIPGGKIDPNDTDPAEAALREAVEELGPIAAEMFEAAEEAFCVRYEESNFTYHNFIVTVPEDFSQWEEDGGPFHVVLNWENDEVAWLTLSELDAMDDLHFGVVWLLENGLREVLS